jgi:hypothetical protein
MASEESEEGNGSCKTKITSVDLYFLKERSLRRVSAVEVEAAVQLFASPPD